jgi:hypothetical protein
VLAIASVPAAAQDVSGYDQPCIAATEPGGYAPVSQLVPAEGSPLERARVRGVVSRALTWQSGETLTVCFRSGSKKARARVAQFGSEWQRYASLKLDFGDPADPRMCQGDPREIVKIDFVGSGPKAGYWSALGRLALKTDHSMNFTGLGEDELPRNSKGEQMPVAEARRVILHEFGHAVGMFHEHQSPTSGCNTEFYQEAVIAYGALIGWPPQQAIANIMQYPNDPEYNFNATEVDRKSIMHYSLPPWLFKTGVNSPCFVTPNFDLSQRDKEFIASVYPTVVGPVASTRGVKAPNSTDHLVSDYRKALQGAGVAPGRVEQLTDQFKATIAP